MPVFIDTDDSIQYKNIHKSTTIEDDLYYIAKKGEVGLLYINHMTSSDKDWPGKPFQKFEEPSFPVPVYKRDDYFFIFQGDVEVKVENVLVLSESEMSLLSTKYDIKQSKTYNLYYKTDPYKHFFINDHKVFSNSNDIYIFIMNTMALI